MTRKLSDIMSRDIISARPSDSIGEVAAKMRDNKIGFIPIIDQGKLSGVVTDRDLAVRGYADRIPDNVPVSEVMTRQCITINANATADDAVRLMSKEKIRRLCIIKDGRLEGVVAIGDLAARHQFISEAGHALSDISTPTRQQLLQ